jgi:DNA-binding beta-propeller fold protein YncE
VAGVGTHGSTDGIGIDASFDRPTGLALSSDGGTLYVADTENNRIRRVDLASAPSHTVTTLAGFGGAGSNDGVGTAATFSYPSGLALTPDDSTLFVADRWNHKLRAVDVRTRTVSTLVGGGGGGSCVQGAGSCGSTDGTGTSSAFSYPLGLAITPDGGTILVTERGKDRLRAVLVSTRKVLTVAGSGSEGWADGLGSDARFSDPTDACVSPEGTVVYVAGGWDDHSIRVVSSALPPPSPHPPPPPPLPPLPPMPPWPPPSSPSEVPPIVLGLLTLVGLVTALASVVALVSACLRRLSKRQLERQDHHRPTSLTHAVPEGKTKTKTYWL